MKRLIAFVLVSACLLCMYGCKKPKGAEPTDLPITEGILDGGADIGTKGAEPTDLPVTEGILDGGADIGIDANP